MRTVKSFTLLLFFLTGLFATSCSDQGVIEVLVTGVRIEPANLEIRVGDEATLQAVIYPADATNRNVSWSTSNHGVVAVSETGIIKGVAEGNAFIVVTTEDGGKIAICSVIVSPPLISITPDVSDVAFSASGRTLYAGDEKIDPTFKVTLTEDVPWNVEIVGATWCTVEKDIPGKTFSLKAAAHESETTAPDNVVVRVTAEDKSVEIIVSQHPVKYDVYVCGAIYYTMSTGTACYWKNGEKIELGVQGTHSYTKQILEHDGDIYILGGDGSEIGYWKNGDFVTLPRDGSSELYRMQIVGDDIHAIGYCRLRLNYWLNGVRTSLETLGNYGYGLHVDGGDVYIAGVKSSKPTIWKNGTAETFADSGTLYGIYMEGGNTYVAGVKDDEVVYWINGTEYAVTGSGYSGSWIGSNSLVVRDGKVCLAGSAGNQWGTDYAAYWIDGDFFSLVGDPSYPSTANSLKFYGDNMYVVGKEKDYEIVDHASYWKNGEITILDTQTYDTRATDILLVRAE